MSIIEDSARTLKASALVAVLHDAGATATTIPYLDDDGWRGAADVAGVRVPSDATRALVARWFVEREQPVSDPFARLNDVAEVAL